MFTKRLLVVFVCLAFCCCSEKAPDRKPTYPLTGQVIVDGQPAAGVSVFCHNVKGMEGPQPTLTSTTTDQEGKFSASTYESGDGIPEGEYALTFEWYEGKPGGAPRPDKLNRRYADPRTSQVRVIVTTSKPNDVGKVELTTK